jgi:hypothetical protein
MVDVPSTVEYAFYWITGLLARGFVTVRNVQTTTRGH